jgi:hypothetical protein
VVGGPDGHRTVVDDRLVEDLFSLAVLVLRIVDGPVGNVVVVVSVCQRQCWR